MIFRSLDKHQICKNSLKKSPTKPFICKKNCEEKSKNNVESYENKNEKDKKFVDDFFAKRIIKPSDLTFPKNIEKKTNKVFSSYIIDNSNPKNQYLLFKKLRYKKSLMKDEIDIYIKRMNNLKVITQNEGKSNSNLIKSVGKLKQNINYYNTIGINKQKHLISLDLGIDNSQKELMKYQTFKYFNVNRAISLPVVQKESVKPKFDFHEYKNKFERPSSPNPLDNEYLPIEKQKEQIKNQLLERKKRQNLFRKRSNYNSKELIESIKPRVFTANQKIESSEKFIPKRIFSGLSTNYNGKNTISLVNINEKLTKNLNFEIKNMNIAEKTASSPKSVNKIHVNYRPSTCKINPASILNYDGLENEKQKNDENLEVYQLTGDQLYQLDVNLNRVVNHNIASFSKNRDVIKHKRMKMHIDENNKLKISFAVQKDYEVTNYSHDIIANNEQVLKTFNNLSDAEKQKLIENFEKNNDMINYIEIEKESDFKEKNNNVIYATKDCHQNRSLKSENIQEQKTMLHDKNEKEYLKSSEYENYFDESSNSLEKESTIFKNNKKLNEKLNNENIKDRKISELNKSYQSYNSNITYIIPKKNKTFIDEKKLNINLIRASPVTKQEKNKKISRPHTAIDKFREAFKLKKSRVNSPKVLINFSSASILNIKIKKENQINNSKINNNNNMELNSGIEKEDLLIKKSDNNIKIEENDLLKKNEHLEASAKLKLSEEIYKNTKNIMKIHPLPNAMINFNNKVKIKKLTQDALLSSYNLNSEGDIKESAGNRYRKKKINIEEILIMHNSIQRKDLNPLKTNEIHMKFSLDKPRIKHKFRPLSSNHFLNRNETLSLKREFLDSFEKHAVDPYNS